VVAAPVPDQILSLSNKGSVVGLAGIHAVAEATLLFHLEVSIKFAIAVQIAIAFKMESFMSAIVNMGFGMVTALGTPKGLIVATSVSGSVSNC